MRKRQLFGAVVTLSVASAAPALAQNANEGWAFSVTPYLWVTTVDTEVVDRTGGTVIDSSADFGDLIDNLSGVFIGKAEARYDRFGVYGDLVFMKLAVDQTIERPVLGTIEREAELETTIGTLSGYYRIVQSDTLDVDLLAGLRYTDLELELDAAGVRADLSEEVSGTITEPVIGARATRRLGERSSLTGYADWGGFEDSTTVWQAYGTWNYQWTPKITGSLGYRYFVIEVEKQGFTSEMTLSGPLVGVTFQF